MKTASDGGLAVITGAAGGIGSAFANQLAERGFRLLLVDRRQTQLEQLCEAITSRHGTPAEPCTVDLCQREEVEGLARRLEQTANLELLVNNAGFGTRDYFFDTAARDLLDMVDLHVAAPVMLTRAALPGMIERKGGAIINVSSLAAWFQSAGNVPYGSTKCFLAVFTMALHQELRGTNVRVQALCPGMVRTDFHATPRLQGVSLGFAPAQRFWMSADKVVNCSLRRLSSKHVLVIPGLGNRIVGRLAQMPLLQPFMQWMARGPRLKRRTAQGLADCPAPAFGIAKSP